jgi:hypothetical protein
MEGIMICRQISGPLIGLVIATVLVFGSRATETCAPQGRHGIVHVFGMIAAVEQPATARS